MSPVLDAPPGRLDPIDPIHDERPVRKRPWTLILLVAAGALAAVFVGRELWIHSYQPIGVGNGIYALQVDGPLRKEVQRLDTYATSPEPGEVAVIPFQKGGSLRMVFPIHHDGWKSVRITDIDYGPQPTDFETVLEPTGLEFGTQATNDPIRSTEAFRPFTLAPDDNPLIGLNYDFVCQRPSNGGSMIIDSFKLRFEAFGVGRWVELTLPWRLVLNDPTKEDCPPGSAVFDSSS